MGRRSSRSVQLGEDQDLVRAYRVLDLIVVVGVGVVGALRHLKPGEGWDPWWARGTVMGLFAAGLALSFLGRTWTRRLPAMVIGLVFVLTGWLAWLEWANRFEASFVTTNHLVILAAGLSLGVLDAPFRWMLAYLGWSVVIRGVALFAAVEPRTAPGPLLAGLVGSVGAVLVSLIVHRRARIRQQESEAQWKRLVAEHPDPILVSIGGRVAFANRAVLDAVGQDRVEAVGARCEEGVAAGSAARIRLERADGREGVFEVRATAVVHGGRKALQFILRDETEQLERVRLLEEARQTAEATARAKADFLATMSHEIRTPLTGIIGVTDLLLAESLSGWTRESVELIKTSGDSLLTVINDILDLTKIEAGRLELETIPFAPLEVVGTSVAILEARARGSRVSLSIETVGEVPEGLLGDPLRLRQILLNLIGNAIKFTEGGTVRVRVIRTEDRGRRRGLRLEVVDDGIGIPADRVDSLFAPFVQAERSTSRRFGGTGLGLDICRRLTEMMGGQIGVESEVAVGSTFWVQLWLEEAAGPRAAASPERAEAHHPLEVLVAEDNRINQKVVSRMLVRLGHAVTVVPDGRAAVEAVRAARFDVVLMDMWMPEMDGLEATRAIRRLDPASTPQPWIVALTASAMASDREACLAAGMDDFLSKPLRRDALGAALARAPAS